MKKFLVNLSAGYLIFTSILMVGLFVYMFVHPSKQVNPEMIHSKFMYSLVIGASQLLPLITGVGLILKREWARFCILMISGLTVFLGVASLVATVFIVKPDNFDKLRMIFIVLEFVFFMIIPILLILLFNDQSVKESFVSKSANKEAIQRPFGITAVAVYQLFGGFMGLVNFFSSHSHLVIVGPWFLEGVGLKVYSIIIPMVLIFIGIGFLKLDKNAWKAALFMQGVFVVASIINFFTASESTIALIKNSTQGPHILEINLLQYKASLAVVTVMVSLLIIYLISSKKYFFKAAV